MNSASTALTTKKAASTTNRRCARASPIMSPRSRG
jgi:hypothetical protein